jgi:hypothetical protein
MVIKLACYWNRVAQWRLRLLAALNEWRRSKYVSLIIELSYWRWGVIRNILCVFITILISFLFLTFFVLFLSFRLVFVIQAVNQITPVHGGCTRRESALSASNEPEKEWILLPSLPFASHILTTMPSSPFLLYLIHCRFFLHPFNAIVVCYFINYEKAQYSSVIQYMLCFLKLKIFGILYFSF